jgi:hypothetical protein
MSRYVIVSRLRNVSTSVTNRAAIWSTSEWFNRRRKSVPKTTLSPNDARRARIDFQFPPEAQDLDVDTAIENVFMNSRRLQQVLPRKRSLRSLEKGHQQRILASAQ